MTARKPAARLELPATVLNKRLPLWYQLAECIRAAILGRSVDDPRRLPTEAALARHYGVSLITIREALASIEAEGLISRHRRKGTFVQPDAPTDQPLRLIGSLETVFSQQQSASAEVLERGTCPPPADLAARFSAPREVVVFRRLRRNAAGVAVSYAINYLPSVLGNAVPLDLLQTWPMTRILRDRLAVPIIRIEDTATATLATPEVASALGVPADSPILLMTGLTIAADGSLADAALIHYRADLYRFSVTFDVTNGATDTIRA